MKFLYDFFPLLLFFAAFKIYGIYAATATAIAASFVQVGFYWYRHRRFETMHLVTLVVIAVFGGMTLVLQDSTFIKWKPTIVSWIFAAALFVSHFVAQRPLVQRLMGSQIELPAAVWSRLNISWALFFFVLGALNVYVAFYYGPDLDPARREELWVDFKVFGITAMTLVFVIAQAFVMAPHLRESQASKDNATNAGKAGD